MFNDGEFDGMNKILLILIKDIVIISISYMMFILSCYMMLKEIDRHIMLKENLYIRGKRWSITEKYFSPN